MTQEDKQLLLKDLATRLFYGVRGVYTRNGFAEPYSCELTPFYYGEIRMSLEGCRSKETYVEFKPYLRPMSSMTEEELNELDDISCLTLYPNGTQIPNGKDYDWLNAHHFDYRRLIEKGLALEAPEGMYKTE